jgi:hypothetical protein
VLLSMYRERIKILAGQDWWQAVGEYTEPRYAPDEVLDMQQEYTLREMLADVGKDRSEYRRDGGISIWRRKDRSSSSLSCAGAYVIDLLPAFSNNLSTHAGEQAHTSLAVHRRVLSSSGRACVPKGEAN